jgi:excisionase family DNA binding protein
VDATLLTIEEAARYLGVSKLTLYGWVSQGKITYISNSHVDRRSQVREDVEAVHAIEERDLTQAAVKVHKYLQENTPGTLGESLPDM